MIGRFVSPIFNTILRLIGLAFIWGITITALHSMNLVLHSMNMMVVAGQPYLNDFVFFLAVVLMIPGAIILSMLLFRIRVVAGAPNQHIPAQTQAQMRPSADSLSMRDLMALLDDDDLDDLRGEIRENLRARIQRLSGAEGESFEDLLADAGGKRKRGGR